jgi:hypothetical protein
MRFEMPRSGFALDTSVGICRFFNDGKHLLTITAPAGKTGLSAMPTGIGFGLIVSGSASGTKSSSLTPDCARTTSNKNTANDTLPPANWSS